MKLPIEKLSDPQNRIPVLVASALAIAAIAIADWLTLPFVSLGFLYLFPIMAAAGFLPRAAIVVLGIGCAVLSEAFSALDPSMRASRLISEALALAGCGLFVSQLLRNRRLIVQTEERLRVLVGTSPAAIIVTGAGGFIELANGSAIDLLAPSTGDLLGHSIGDFLPELQSALRFDGGVRFRASMQSTARRGNGETFVAEVWFSTYPDRGANRLAAIIADVGEERGGEEPAGGPEADNIPLNSRQLAVLRLVLRGSSNKDIALRLEMTPSAVKNILQQLFAKAGARNRSQLVRAALERYRDLL